jgi:uncharacterized protein YndB with AHSA1/START domain
MNDTLRRSVLSIITVLALVTPAGLARAADPSAPAVDEKILRTECSIHQEVVFHASPERVYRILTSTHEFDGVVHRSAAMRSGMKLGTQSTRVSPNVGGEFVLFGGHILGRQVELVPGRLVVEAWRVGNWTPGLYSIARFELRAEGGGTRLVFDHTGFPSEEAEHLAEGWRGNYWAPMAESFAAADSASHAK